MDKKPEETTRSVVTMCDNFGGAALAFCWISGVVLATGWWKLAAFCFPPYSLYLFVERLLVVSGFVF